MHRSIALGLALTLGVVTLAVGQSPDEQLACQDDAFRLCPNTIPDRERTFQCMMANLDSLSPACRTVIAKYLPDPPRKKASKKKPKKDRPASLTPPAPRL